MSSRSKVAPAAPSVAPSIAKKYKFKREIGKGAYGTVW
jgi:hypothetical protein